MATPKSKLYTLSAGHPILKKAWEFREDCELSHIVDVLAHAMHKQEMIMQGPTAGNEVYRNLQYLEMLMEDPEYFSLVGRLENLSTKLYTNVKKQVDTLKSELSNQVEIMGAIIRKRRDELLVKAGVDTLVGGNDKPQPMQRMNWSNIDLVGGRFYVLTKLQEYTNVSTDKVTTNTLAYVAAKWKQDLSVQPSISPKDTDKLQKQFPELSREEFDKYLSYFTDSYAYRSLLTVTRRAWNDSAYFQTVKSMNSSIPVLHKMYTVLSTSDLMSNTLGDKFSKNLEAVHLLYLSMTLYLINCRENVYKSSVVLDADTLNDDVFEEVEDGGTTDVTEDDIMKYIRVYHVIKKISVPNTGIALKTISTAKPNTDAKFEDYSNKLNSKLKTMKAQATATAMSMVLNDAITQRFTSVDVASTYRGVLPKYLSMVQEEQYTIDDVLYQYFIDTDYKTTKLGTVYSMYRAGIVNTVANESHDVELSATTQHDIEQNIVMQLSADFLASLVK